MRPLDLLRDLFGNNEIELLQATEDLDATYMHQVDQDVRVDDDRRRKVVLPSLVAGDEYIGGPGIQKPSPVQQLIDFLASHR